MGDRASKGFSRRKEPPAQPIAEGARGAHQGIYHRERLLQEAVGDLCLRPDGAPRRKGVPRIVDRFSKTE